MLRHLLGHWKAHRRKPSLLPEDIESPSDDPSKVNPLYEDSEGSVSSLQRHDQESPKVERASTTGVDLDLVDISIPADASTDKTNDIEENPDDVINQINIALDSSFVNENDNSEEQIKNTPESKHREIEEFNTSSTNMENNKKSSESIESVEDKPRMSRLHQIIKSNPELKRELTSDFKSVQGITPLTEKKAPESKPVEQVSKEENQKEEIMPADNAKPEQSTGQIAIPSTSSGITENDSNQANAPAIKKENPISEIKPKSKFKKRAIDELIKKFQGSNSENENPIQSVSSFLHSSNQKTMSQDNVTTGKKDSQDLEVDGERKKESLSTIFSFPPPPPLEPQKKNAETDNSVTKNAKPTTSTPGLQTNSSVGTELKTRTDSSLSRNKTASSSNIREADKGDHDNEKSKQIKSESSEKERPNSTSTKQISTSQPTNQLPEPVAKKEKEILKEPSTSKENFSSGALAKTENKQSGEMSSKNNEAISGKKKEPLVSNLAAKSKGEKSIQQSRKQSENLAKSSRSPESKVNSSVPKTSATISSTLKETNAAKSNSEDSGITRGDQISSEVTPDIPQPKKENDITAPIPAKRNTKERRTMHSRAKGCKCCKRYSYDGEARLKRSQCDEYYDIVTGLHKARRFKYSDSWASDLSPEEMDLIRRFRRRGTLRSNAPSVKSRHSRHSRKLDNGHFHRHHLARRSVSDESTFASSSACSCDDCWLFLVKDYAYGRASLRGTTPDQPLCTCRLGRPEFLGRRVKFRSDTIPEASPSERTSTSPPIPEESIKKEDATDTRSTSNLSSISVDDVLKNGKLPDKLDQKGKNVKEKYRLVTPWELEEWDLAMKRHLLQKRRKRARYMGFMALAMVVFIGLVVAILMVYLRRKVI